MSERLEKELGRLVPVAPSESLEKGIAASLTYRASGTTPRLADTLLRSLLSLGAAAAVVIVALLAMDWSSGRPSVPVESVARTPAQDSITVADTPRLLARLSDSNSIDSPVLPQN